MDLDQKFIQLFRSKMDMDGIIKNLIHAYP